MCDAATALFVSSLALSAAQATAGYMGASQNAQEQKAYQEAQARAYNEAAQQNAQNAIKEQVEQTAAERTKEMQQNAAAAREQQKIQTDFLQKRGTAIASSPNAGGASLDSLMADYERAYAMHKDVVDEQLKMQGVASDINVRGYRDRAESRINTQQGYIPAPVYGPNAMASALGFAGSALNSYNYATNFGRTPITSKGAPKK